MTASGRPDDETLVSRVEEGDLRTIARVLTRVEADDEAVRPVLDRLYPRTGRAHLIGVTGVPGAGKSTLLSRLAIELRKAHDKVALIAVDPSSALTGGAILGDRVRMGALEGAPGVFIRSMASRGAPGGLAYTTMDAIDVLDAAGYGAVLVETVGVGQDEFEIAGLVDTTIVVSAPGLGDDVQAIKAGILEMADIHVVNKADKPDAQKAARDIQATLAIAGSRRRINVPVLLTCAESGEGVGFVARAIAEHFRELEEHGHRSHRLAERCKRRILRAAEEIVERHIEDRLSLRSDRIFEHACTRAQSPRIVAHRLLREMKI